MAKRRPKFRSDKNKNRTPGAFGKLPGKAHARKP